MSGFVVDVCHVDLPFQAALSRVSDGHLRGGEPYAAAAAALLHADQRAKQVNDETRVSSGSTLCFL